MCEGRELFGHGRGMCQWGTSDGQPSVVKLLSGGGIPLSECRCWWRRMAPATLQIHLRQRLARIDAVDCPSPAAMYAVQTSLIRVEQWPDLFQDIERL